MEEEGQTRECAVCSCEVTPPYIRCRQCPGAVNICLACFSRGAEIGPHQNDHAYCVVRDNFPVFEDHWTAAEEVTLLESVETHGYGNWTDISKKLSNKSATECERHYNRCYINNPQSSLPKFRDYKPVVVPAPFVFKLSDNPPRPQEGSTMCQEMAGYSAPRGEFAVEHNNFAEMDICQLTPVDEKLEDEEEEDMELLRDLKLTLVHSYRMKLKERHRRKRIIKDHGLINIRNIIWYQQSHMPPEVIQIVKRLRVFTSLMTPVHSDILNEALTYEHELKDRIDKLQDYRTQGLKRLRGISLFKLLQGRRSTSKQKRHLLTDVMVHMRDDAIRQSWLQKQGASDDPYKITSFPSAPRKQAARLKIAGMPGYERLLPAEREICETQRLMPEAFLEYSAILLNEANKFCGKLRLGQARPLIKIDVNKTRKIYDYLVSEGKILKE